MPRPATWSDVERLLYLAGVMVADRALQARIPARQAEPADVGARVDAWCRAFVQTFEPPPAPESLKPWLIARLAAGSFAAQVRAALAESFPSHELPARALTVLLDDWHQHLKQRWPEMEAPDEDSLGA